MYSFIFGFHRLVWCPKWTPASRSSFIETEIKYRLLSWVMGAPADPCPRGTDPNGARSAFRILEARPGSPLAVFLSLLDPGIAREKPRLFQPGSEFPVVVHQGPGETMTDGAGLPRMSSARDANLNVELVGGLGQKEGLPDHELQAFSLEVLVQYTIVDSNFPGSRPEKHPRRGVFPPARAVILDRCHPASPALRP